MARSVMAIFVGVVIWIVSRELQFQVPVLAFVGPGLAGYATSMIAGRSHRGHGLALAGIVVLSSWLLGAPLSYFVRFFVVPTVAIMVGSEINAVISGKVQFNMSDRDRRLVFICLGVLAGAFIGFLTRPSAFLIGQLPFETVLSRGGNLSGVDQLLVPTAQASFNQMLLYAVAGGVVGFLLPFALTVLKGAPSGAAVATTDPSYPAHDSERAGATEILNNDAVLKMLGAGLGEAVVLEKIRQSRCMFDLSASGLAHLKQNGASDGIISGMLQRSQA